MQFKFYGIQEYFDIQNACRMIRFCDIPISYTLFITSNKNRKWYEQVIQSLQSVNNINKITKLHYLSAKHDMQKSIYIAVKEINNHCV